MAAKLMITGKGKLNYSNSSSLLKNSQSNKTNLSEKSIRGLKGTSLTGSGSISVWPDMMADLSIPSFTMSWIKGCIFSEGISIITFAMMVCKV